MEETPYIPVELQQLQKGMFKIPPGLFAQEDFNRGMVEAIKKNEDPPEKRSINEVPVVISMRDEDDALSSSSSVLDTDGTLETGSISSRYVVYEILQVDESKDDSKGVGQHPCLDMLDEEVDWGFDDPMIEVDIETQVLFGLSGEELKVLDDFEDDEYIRRVVEPQVLEDGAKVQAYTYVWADMHDEKLFGDWNYEEWRRLHFEDFYAMSSDFANELISSRPKD
ncbi:hypothetical protein L7F22_010029 [Adiantum nelumboides]|nr:hypothetical protein [Adiantum nelumboides]